MSTTPVYGSEHLQPNSANPEVPVNEAIDAIERALNNTVDWTIAGDVQPTVAQMAEGFFHKLGGSPAGPFAFGIPAAGRHFVVINDSGQTCTVYVQGQSGGGVDVADGETVTLRSDGVNVEEVASGGGGSGGLTEISSVTTSGSQTSVSFTGIAATYRDLIVVAQARSATAAATDSVFARLNNDSGSNYNWQVQQGFGTTNSASQSLGTTSMNLGPCPAATATAGYASGHELIVPNYAGAVFNKECKAQWADGHSDAGNGTNVGHVSNVWRTVGTAVNRVDLFLSSGAAFVDGSVVTLYGRGGG